MTTSMGNSASYASGIMSITSEHKDSRPVQRGEPVNQAEHSHFHRMLPIEMQMYVHFSFFVSGVDQVRALCVSSAL